MECLDGHLVQPMYPGRLVETAGRLLTAGGSSSGGGGGRLIQGSYTKAGAKLLNVTGQLTYGDQAATFLRPSNLQVSGFWTITFSEWRKYSHASEKADYFRLFF